MTESEGSVLKDICISDRKRLWLVWEKHWPVCALPDILVKIS